MSNDYIRRQDAIDKINERQRKLIYCFGFENDAVKIMDIAKSIVIAIPSAQSELESADVVLGVRCRDCRYHVAIDKCCHPDGLLCAKDNNFCSYGERKHSGDMSRTV